MVSSFSAQAHCKRPSRRINIVCFFFVVLPSGKMRNAKWWPDFVLVVLLLLFFLPFLLLLINLLLFLSSDKRMYLLYIYRKFNERGKNRQQTILFLLSFDPIRNFAWIQRWMFNIFFFLSTQNAYNDGTLLKSQNPAYASHLQ